MRTRIALTVVTLFALFGYTTAASVASFSAETKNPANKFASGTIVLSNTKQGGSACADADNASETYHGTGSMCGAVQLYIQQWTNSNFTGASTCVYGGGTATTCAFSAAKTMADYATNYGSSGTAQTIGSGLASGASAYFTVAVQLPSTAGNSLQGRQATMDWTWHVDQ